MFRDIPQAVEVTQGHLKALEAWRAAASPDPGRHLRQVSPETGKLLAILLAGAPAGNAFEAGTGAGYAALWLALACRATGRTLTTCEIDPAKAELARHTLGCADVADVASLVAADARQALANAPTLAFCLIDTTPDSAAELYEAALARLVPGGLLCLPNPDSLGALLDHALHDPRVDATTTSDLLVCRAV